MKDDILKTYEKVSLDYIGNSNSLHKLGLESKKLEEAASKQILEVLSLSNYEIIYTSGNAESFTMLVNCFGGSINSLSDEYNSVLKEMGYSISDKYKYKHIDIDLNKKYDNLSSFDFITIEDEIPFFGVLLKKKSIEISPLINGGASFSIYRSGTSSTSLIASFSKLIKLKYKK